MISIITPCKDLVSQGRESFFRKMMESLSVQTYRDLEHILVDSDSQDGTLDILEEYVESGLIDVLISERDNNLHEALNKGMRHVRGGFVYVMNTDNYFTTPLFFERSLEAVENYGVDFTHADRSIIKRGGGKPSIKKGDERTAFFRMPFRWQTMLMKREIYDEIGDFDERYEIAADYKFMMEMLLAGYSGHYFPEVFIQSLDGGITADRGKCIEEVTQVLYECYGAESGLTVEECRDIYLRRISPDLFSKICSNVQNNMILDSLTYCYREVQPLES